MVVILAEALLVTRRTEGNRSHANHGQLGTASLFDDGKRDGLEILASAVAANRCWISGPAMSAAVTRQSYGPADLLAVQGVGFSADAGDVHDLPNAHHLGWSPCGRIDARNLRQLARTALMSNVSDPASALSSWTAVRTMPADSMPHTLVSFRSSSAECSRPLSSVASRFRKSRAHQFGS